MRSLGRLQELDEGVDLAIRVGKRAVGPDDVIGVPDLVADWQLRSDAPIGGLLRESIPFHQALALERRIARDDDDHVEVGSASCLEEQRDVGDGRAASNRRARLVEYALAARLITSADLAWLDAVGPEKA